MSIARISDSSKKQFNRRHDPDHELDVFEAAMYYSGQTEAGINPNWKSRRMSLDMPIFNNKRSTQPPQNNHKKSQKQRPSSPAAKLTSFLNSLFKSKSVVEDHNESVKRKLRRSSIGNFPIPTDRKSLYSYSSSAKSGFRTPSSYNYQQHDTTKIGNRTWVDKNVVKDDQNGYESESSSDLFELENYDLVYKSSTGLPVFETTQVNGTVKRAPSIACNGKL